MTRTEFLKIIDNAILDSRMTLYIDENVSTAKYKEIQEELANDILETIEKLELLELEDK